MATTIHVPLRLLERADKRAKALGVSRNRLILDALEASLGTNEAWSPELVGMLARPLSPNTAKELARSLVAVRRLRVSRRRAPTL
jgi:metal-responsive CopG/Arc/MetJ family transcriptional regulator